MKFALSPLAAVLAAASFALVGTGADRAHAQAASFTLSSPDLPGNVFPAKFILNGFGCSGANTSPALVWSNVPAGTKSLALQVHDPDAPTGSGFWHWAVYDMPPGTAGLAQGAGNYGGPCPPQGDRPHRYVFTLYALAVDKVAAAGSIPKTGTAALYSFVINKGVGPALLGKASFTATYGR